ncbi:MAG: hypothetical protein Q7U68_06215, partial [Candidatus Roizmanbacteria bacterium]|nr:hypothetical protein [Candidatus Roizmanbacteria bacterium]
HHSFLLEKTAGKFSQPAPGPIFFAAEKRLAMVYQSMFFGNCLDISGFDAEPADFAPTTKTRQLSDFPGFFIKYGR